MRSIPGSTIGFGRNVPQASERGMVEARNIVLFGHELVVAYFGVTP
jgi:hypothetical protein